MTSEELNALRENTIAGNQQTMAILTQLQAQLQTQIMQISAEHGERFDNIESILASVLERLDRLEQLNRNAIGFATGES